MQVEEKVVLEGGGQEGIGVSRRLLPATDVWGVASPRLPALTGLFPARCSLSPHPPAAADRPLSLPGPPQLCPSAPCCL
ncbi:hypothetical protein O3P69_012134 [Scylla paramamosain]|uniref:Uncharacterized protein n=1 Tax=Scylla paramamosain TaxID=85552 RepID=A0AAW0TC47_SCYPA